MTAVRISPKGTGDVADSPTIRSATNTELNALMSTNIAESLRISMQSLIAERGIVVDRSLITETTLIRNGAFCGRRFSLAGFSLVWFQEESQVKFYSPAGALEQSCSVSQFCLNAMQSGARELRRAA